MNGLLETLEARFEVSSLEVQALRNRSLRMAGTRRRQADTDTGARWEQGRVSLVCCGIPISGDITFSWMDGADIALNSLPLLPGA